MRESSITQSAECYCEDGSAADASHPKCLWQNESLKCVRCQSKIHIKCLKTPTPSNLLNDYLYDLTCAKCTGTGEESYVRPKKLPMVYILTLLLHNLQSTKEGLCNFFHYKNDIHKLLITHSSHLLPSTARNPAAAKIASACSSYSGTHIISGLQTLNKQGFWKLKNNLPPFLSQTYAAYGSTQSETLLADTTEISSTGRPKRSSRKKKQLPDDFVADFTMSNSKKKRMTATPPSAAASAKDLDDSVASIQDIDVDIVDEVEAEPPSLPTIERSYSLFDDLKTEPMEAGDGDVLNEINEDIKQEISNDYGDMYSDLVDVPELSSGIDIDTATLYNELSVSPVKPAVIIKSEPIELSPAPADLLNRPTSSISNTGTDVVSETVERMEDDASGICQHLAEDVAHESTGNKCVAGGNEDLDLDRTRLSTCDEELEEPKLPTLPSGRRWSVYEEERLLCILNDYIGHNNSGITSQVRLLRRMLKIRKIKRSHGMKLFDISDYLSKEKSMMLQKSDELQQTGVATAAPIVQSSDNISVLDRYQSATSQPHTSSFVPFIQRLHGSNHHLVIVKSSYTARMLKPYIWRDMETKPPKLKILEAIRQRSACGTEDTTCQSNQKDSIDYKYVTAQHISVINRICHEAFWPSIDLSECLQYPDFSCVAMYKKLVIGFAFMVPDASHNEAYISFIYTHPDWRGAGIATVMVYHLIQTCMGKDVTLHVSMTNPAIGLYLKFGFKVVEVIRNFYEKYHPVDSKQSPHAFYMKLERY